MMAEQEEHSRHQEHAGHEASAAHTAHAEHGAHAAPHEGAVHEAHGTAAPPERDEVQPEQEQLQHLRLLQATLWPIFERDLKELRAHDTEAQQLMDTDPKGHTEMMRMPQEHKALIRDLPTQLLRREAALYHEIQEARRGEAGVRELPHGVLMAWHVLAEHWVHIAVMPLGAWLLFSPAALAYRSGALAWSDMISGALVLVFAVLSMARHPWAPWANAVVGLWVAFAPLAFWAPTPAAYANDTLVGALIVAFSVIIPMRTEMPGPDVPPGWTYNPSTWPQRAPVIALATLSFFLSRYMASFQLGHIPTAWDPLFGRGTELVLTSAVSRSFPVSDAGLGAYTYIVELLSAVMGDARRWRTMPWMVAMFGFVVVPLGITSTVLVMLQPVAVGAWCTICLLTALFMLVMVAVSLDEIVAMIQYLIIGKRAGQSAWRLFWTGGTLPQPVEDVGLTRPAERSPSEMLWGSSFFWPLLAAALVGVWVIASPWVFGTRGPAFTFESVFGALAVVTAFVAWAEVTRAVRFLNVLIGLAIAAATWFFPDVSLAARLNDLIAAALLIGLSIPRGPINDRYGGWNPFIL